MATASHIDLGELTDRPYEPPAQAGWRCRWPVLHRAWPATLVAVLALVGLAPAPGPGEPLTELLTVPVNTFWLDYQVDEDRLYVMDQPERSGLHRLTAHPLTSDVAGWQIVLPGEHAALVNSSAGPPLLVRQHGSEPALLNIDPADGSIRWRLAGSLIEATDDTLLLYAPPPVHGFWSGLLAADPVSGEVRWRAAEVRWAWVMDPARVLLIGGWGQLTVHDLQSGEPLVESRPPVSILGSTVWIVDGSVLVPHPPVDHNDVRGLGDALSAFDSQTLAHRWSIDLSREDAALLRAVSHCGRWLCLFGATVWAVDPAAPVRVVRYGSDEQPTWLGQLRPDWSGVEPVAALGGQHEYCVTDHGYLVCGPQSGQLNTGELAVWRFALP